METNKQESKLNRFKCNYEHCGRILTTNKTSPFRCTACGHGTMRIEEPKNHCCVCGAPIYFNVKRDCEVICGSCVLKSLAKSKKPQPQRITGSLSSLKKKYGVTFTQNAFSIELLKKHCLQCQEGNAEDIKRCRIEECPLYYFRRRSQPLSEKEVKRLVGKYCLMCRYGNIGSIINCTERYYPDYGKECVFYPFRFEGLLETESGKKWDEMQKSKKLDSEDSNKDSNKAPGKSLKQAREKKGWSQTRLASYLSVTRQFISKMERGKTALSSQAREFTEKIIKDKGLQKGKKVKERDGERLIKARKVKELNQKQLASLLGITQQYVSLMEKNKKPLIQEVEKFIEETFYSMGA